MNNRLLCELIVHENFRRLLVDMEIYVDSIAGMQIRNLNVHIDVVREELLAKHNPNRDDPYLRVLESAHVDENWYFSQMVHEDMDVILRDIRDAHRKDSTSAPETSTMEQMRKDLEEAASFKGSRAEKMAVVYCKRLGIDYTKLTEEEFRVLVGILGKSKLVGGGRGKR